MTTLEPESDDHNAWNSDVEWFPAPTIPPVLISSFFLLDVAASPKEHLSNYVLLSSLVISTSCLYHAEWLKLSRK